MKMDFSKFKKISSDSKSTTLKHPEGHKIVIAHHALSPAMRKQVAAIPMNYSDGGDVEENSFGKDLSEAAQNVKDVFNDYALEDKIPSGSDFAARYDAPAESLAPTPVEPMGNIQGPAPASLAPPVAVNPAPQENSNAFGMDQYGNDLRAGVGALTSAAQAEAKAKGDLGNRQAALLGQQQNEMMKIQADGQARLQHYMDQADKVAQDAMNGHINPNHYMESMSSEKKVATAIGLILGGMGGGLTGQENPAAKFLQQQIEKDVESQRANLDQKNNLMSHFLRQGESVQNATNLSRAFTANIYATRLEAEAAKAQSPLAMAAAKKEAAQLRLQYAPVLQQAAMHGAALNALRGAADPEMKIRMGTMGGVIPQKDSEDMYKELTAAKNHAAQTDAVLKYFDRASGDNSLGNRALHAGFEPASVAGIQNVIMPYLKDAEGRINESELERTDKMIPRPGDSPQKVKQKREALIDFLHEKAPETGRLSAYGINPEQFGRRDAQGNKKIQLGPPVRK